jgi:hypothetical protein
MPCKRGCTSLTGCIDNHPGIEIDAILRCYRGNICSTISEVERVRATRYHKLAERNRLARKKMGDPIKQMGKFVPDLYKEARRHSKDVKGITFQISHESVGMWELRCHMVKSDDDYTMDVMYHRPIYDKKDSVNDAIMWIESVYRTIRLSKNFFSKGEET